MQKCTFAHTIFKNTSWYIVVLNKLSICTKVVFFFFLVGGKRGLFVSFSKL